MVERMVCHRTMTMVTNTHLKRHALSVDEYRKKFPGVTLGSTPWLETWRNSEKNKQYARDLLVHIGQDEELQTRRKASVKTAWKNVDLLKRHSDTMKSVVLMNETYAAHLRNKPVTDRMRMSNFDRWVIDHGYSEAVIRQQEWQKNNVLPTSSRDTKIELRVRDLLDELGHMYLTQFAVLHYRCDVYVPALNLIIEANGDYWHANPTKHAPDDLIGPSRSSAASIWERDVHRVHALRNMGFTVLMLWESDIKSLSAERLMALMKECN